MKVLVTGSTGRVGRAIYLRLCREHDVVGLDRVPSSAADFVGDLADVRLLERALSGVDAIVHTAALHAPQVGIVADDVFEAINVVATETLARRAIERGVRRFVFTSTTALYGAASTPNDRAEWVDESTVPEPKSIYHRTKLAAERVLEAIADEGRLAVTVLRMSRCFPEPAATMAVHACIAASTHATSRKRMHWPCSTGSRAFDATSCRETRRSRATTSTRCCAMRRRCCAGGLPIWWRPSRGAGGRCLRPLTVSTCPRGRTASSAGARATASTQRSGWRTKDRRK